MLPGRVPWAWLRTSWRQRRTSPPALRSAVQVTIIAVPNGSHRFSSARVHFASTGRPGSARASSAASSATSSAPLWP